MASPYAFMVLGAVAFDVAPFNADRVDINTDTSFASHKVMGAGEVYEHTGDGPGSVKIKGKCYPQALGGGLSELDALEAMRLAGTPHHLMRGDGAALGFVLIDKLEIDHEMLDESGIGREVQFTISCHRLGDGSGGGLGGAEIFDLIGGFMAGFDLGSIISSFGDF